MGIKIGDRVRSFDFRHAHGDGDDLEGERACYIEGIVESFARIEGCDRYVIRVDRDVWQGQDVPHDARGCRVGTVVNPPLNETPSTTGRATCGVDLIESAK